MFLVSLEAVHFCWHMMMMTMFIGCGGRDDFDRGYGGRSFDRDYDDRDRYGGRRGWDDGKAANFILLFIIILSWYWLQQVEEDIGLSVGAAQIASQDRSMWRTLRPSAVQ